MTLQLSSDLNLLLRERMETGLYPSPQDAVMTALELLRDVENLRVAALPTVGSREELLARVAESHRQLESGEYVDFDNESLGRYFDALKQRAMAKAGRSVA